MYALVPTRRHALRLALASLALPMAGIPLRRARAAALPPVMVWKDANCGCCGNWIRHIEGAGFTATVRDMDDMAALKQARGVPEALQSCHTAAVGGYVVEGHVPADDIKRLLAEQPEARGLAVPGMPQSAPGMGDPGEPYAVVLFGTPAGNRVYAQY
jgi:hypothetical protein